MWYSLHQAALEPSHNRLLLHHIMWRELHDAAQNALEQQLCGKTIFFRAAGRGKYNARLGRVTGCRSKEGAEEIRSFKLSGKEIFSNYNETKSK